MKLGNKAINLKHLSILAYLILGLSAIGLFEIHALFGNGFISILIQVIGFGLMVWARVTFGWRSFHPGANSTKGGLVTSGPYHYIRHPIYSGIILFLWTGIISHLSFLSVLVGIVATGAVLLRVFSEEKLIILTYPEYKQYAEKTKRFIPFLI